MSKSIRVYSPGSNPSIDAPLFYITPHDALTRMEARYVRYLSPTAVELQSADGLHDRTDCPMGGLFSSSWLPRWSAHYLVWQMTT